ncbi:MAG: 2-hydroxyacid dehydrogenase [Gammaproteobacteria bacterium]
MAAGPLVVTYELDAEARSVIADSLDGAGEVVFLQDFFQDESPAGRAAALSRAGVVLARNTALDLEDEELALLSNAMLLQFVTAGVDFIPLSKLPPSLPVAFNGGGYSEPMAEHGLAMTLAAAKRLFVEHAELARGQFNQFTMNRMLAGGIAGILGFGGIGVASARLLRGLGMSVQAINRRGASDEPVDWMGGPEDLDTLLAAADVLIVSAPLTRATRGLIGSRELRLMKPDAIVVNLARGEIIDEAALYRHLKACPAFTACIDAWWVEPIRHGAFRMGQPFLDLPNVIASPHNSASVRGWHLIALRRATANCRRALLGEAPQHLIGMDERLA